MTGVRLDPKLKYLAELAARKQRRTLSSFVEWAIEDALGRFLLEEPSGYNDRGISFIDAANDLWDVDEADRFAKVALGYPGLLTHEEQVLWKLVRENGFLWRGGYRHGKWVWSVDLSSLDFDRLRRYWPVFNAVARGEADASVLPTWVKEKAEPKPGPDDDLEIPF
nr:D93 [uncultured bacterium]